MIPALWGKIIRGSPKGDKDTAHLPMVGGSGGLCDISSLLLLDSEYLECEVQLRNTCPRYHPPWQSGEPLLVQYAESRHVLSYYSEHF